MSLLTQPHEFVGKQTLAVLIYGQPGIGKSTVALSMPNPVCLDFDKGMGRVEAGYRAPSLQVQNYEQVLALLQSDELAPFSTVVVDTLGKLVDSILEYVGKQNPKLLQRDGSPSQKAYGAAKTHFSDFMRALSNLGKHVIFVAHESEEKSNDATMKRPDCAGSARKDIMKELDAMGYMESTGNGRVITFQPSDSFYAKNSVGLNGQISVPMLDGRKNNFLEKTLVKKHLDNMQGNYELRQQYDALMALIRDNIAGLDSAEALNDYKAEMANKQHLWGSAYEEKELLMIRANELGCMYNREAGAFVAPEKPTEEKESEASYATVADNAQLA